MLYATLHAPFSRIGDISVDVKLGIMLLVKYLLKIELNQVLIKWLVSSMELSYLLLLYVKISTYSR